MENVSKENNCGALPITIANEVTTYVCRFLHSIVKVHLVVPAIKPILGYLFVAMAVCGCASTGTAPEIAKTEYQVDRLPLVAGVYYPPELRDYSTRNRPGLFSMKVSFGERVIESINFALTGLFDKLVDLSEWPQMKPSSEALDLVIVPRLIDSNRLEVSLFNPTGDDLGKLEAVGNVENSYGLKNKLDVFGMLNAFSRLEDIDLLRIIELRNAVARLVVALAAHPAVVNRVNEVHHQTSTTQGQSLSNNGFASTKAAIGLAIIPKWENYYDSLQYPPDIEGCMEKAFRKSYPEITLVPAQNVRLAVFPWLEVGIVPEEGEKLLEVLNKPRLLAQLNDINVRYMATINLTTNEGEFKGPFFCGYGYGGGGCLGFESGEIKTIVSGNLLDMTTGKILDEPIDAKSKGKAWHAGYVVPFWNSGDSEEKACAEVADQIVKRMAH